MADERVAPQVAGERCWAAGGPAAQGLLPEPGSAGAWWPRPLPPRVDDLSAVCLRERRGASSAGACLSDTRILPELPRLTPQTVKKLPVMQENRVRSLGSEEPLEKGMAPTLEFLPGEFHGQRSLAGYTVHGVAKSQKRLTE